MTTTPSTAPDTVDVLVVGAGPTGLLLAGDLAAQGLSVALAERRPHETSNTTRAFAVHARTLELLDTRGVADELVKTGTPSPPSASSASSRSTSPGCTPASPSC